MLEQSLRQPYEKIAVDPLVQLIDFRFTPLQVTILAGLLGLLVIPALLLGLPILAICLLLASGYCDSLDGALARHQQNHSPLGAVFDIVTDRLVEFAVILGLYLIHPESRSLSVIFMLGSILCCITSFLVVGIFTENASHKSFHYSSGIMERAEAFCFFIVMILLPAQFNLFAVIFIILVFLTAFIRLKEFYKANSALV